MGKAPKDIRDVIMNKMESEGRTLSWLAEKTDINYNTLYSILKRKIFPITEVQLNKINAVLETDFVRQ